MKGDLSRPPKFPSTEVFSHWKMRFAAYITSTGSPVTSLLKGMDVRDPDDASLAKLDDREKLEMTLFSALVMAFSPDDKEAGNATATEIVIPFCGLPACGTKAWRALEGRFAPNAKSSAIRMLSKFISLQMLEGEDANEFVARSARMYSDVLSLGGSQFSVLRDFAPLQIASLVNGIRGVHGFVDFRERILEELDSGSLGMQPGDYAAVCTRLMQKGLRVKEEAADAHEVELAAFRVTGAQQRPGGGGGVGGGRRVPQCHNCSEVGHISLDCKAKVQVCTKCGVRGHQAQHCEDVQAIRRRTGGGGGRQQRQQTGGRDPGVGDGPKRVAFMVQGAVGGLAAGQYRGALLGPERLAKESGHGAMLVERASGGPELYLDTCATVHVFKDRSMFVGPLRPCAPVTVANRDPAPAAGVGTARVQIQDGQGSWVEATFSDVVLCPDFAENLVSWGALQRKGFGLMADCEGVISPDGDVFPLDVAPTGPRFRTKGCVVAAACAVDAPVQLERAAEVEVPVEGVPVEREEKYSVDVAAKAGEVAARVAKASAKATEEKKLWHGRLGHLNERTMDRLVTRRLGTGVGYSVSGVLPPCSPCREMKSHRTPLGRGIVQSLDRKPQALPVASHEAVRQRSNKDVQYADIWGPVTPAAIGGIVAKLGVLHAETGVVKHFSMRSKGSTLKALQTYHAEVMPIRELRTDNEAVFRSEAVSTWAAEQGICLSNSAPYTPEQVARIERYWRTMAEGGGAMLRESGLPDEFWSFAMDTMAYVYNRTPRDSNADGVSPMQAYTGEVPHLEGFRVFGCKAFMHVPKQARTKLQPKARAGIFVGYQPKNNTYLVWVPADDGWSNVTKGRLYESRDVTFDETWRYARVAAESGAGASGSVGSDSEEDDVEDAPVGRGEESAEDGEDAEERGAVGSDLPLEVGDPALLGYCETVARGCVAQEELGGSAGLRRSARSTKGKQTEWWTLARGQVAGAAGGAADPAVLREDVVGGGVGDSVGDLVEEAAFAAMVTGSSDPTMWEVLHGPESHQWRAAYVDERASLLAREVYDRVRKQDVLGDRLRKILKTKAIYRKKFLADGSLDKFKARVVVNGAAQKSGRDFAEGELYAPVAKFTSFRTLVSLAVANEWELRQFDVETAFLYAPLGEEIYVSPPAGFEEYDEEGCELVWKLKKSLYGLRQSPRNWYQEFSGFLLDYGFEKSPHDPCVFTFKKAGVLKCVFIVYVDDVPSGVAGDSEWYKEFIVALRKKYNLKEGPLEWCLGIEIVRDANSVELRQTKYINDILERFDMADCKGASVPLDPGSVFSYEDSPKTPEQKAMMEQLPYSRYRSLVGSLLYCAVATRPDISCAVSKISHVMSNPGPTHYTRAIYLLRYLKQTKHLGLKYTRNCGKNANVLTAYCDSDFAGCIDTRRSTSGYVFQLNGGPVSWYSKLQATVALSTTEAEYMALSACACDAVFLRGLLQYMDCEQTEPTVMFEDNIGCLCLTKDEVLHARTKHIDIRYHYLRELVKAKVCVATYCRTDEMLADILTKLLAKGVFTRFRDKLLGYV